MNIYSLIVDALLTGKSIDYSVICSWSRNSSEHRRALQECDFYGVVVANRPSSNLQLSNRKEANSCQTS